ncbi:hypothetical protein LCGC14_1052370 [marine sediment metagenome]|uniref:Acylneuraminate cytidylyltransferase family protein n=1 Tax=marine sediment metagenome TaxID=412755 RepID=A0A0F9QUJ0_9ZZZZ
MDNILVLLLVKENSKRLKNKNLKGLSGDPKGWKQPLYWYALAAAVKADMSKYVYISTESKRVVNNCRYGYMAAKYGNTDVCPIRFIMRPEFTTKEGYELSDVCRYVIYQLKDKYDTLIMIQPSNPFVKAEDIKNCYDLFVKHDRKTVRSVTKINKQVWRPISYYEGGDQDFPNTADNIAKIKVITPYSTNSFVGNGSIVIMDVKRFLEEKTLADIVTIPYIMPKERSVDIDDEFDFNVAQMIMERKL